MKKWSKGRTFGLLVTLVGVGAGSGWLAWDWYDCLPPGLTAEYVGREACVRCHEAEYEKWKESHHDLAMDRATAETVLGNFDDAEFESNGVRSRFFTKDGAWFVHTQGRDGEMETFELTHAFGVDPLQQYLAEFPDGRKQALPIAWDVVGKRWFHLYEKENVQPHESLYWTNRAMNWNFMCAECHSTDLRKNYDAASDTYHTEWSEIDVSCEACHGPGSIHLMAVERKSLFRDRRYGTGLAPLKGGDGQVQIDACGKCHSRRRIVDPDFTPGDRFLDHYDPELLDSEAYHADGQVRDEDYVYGSFHLSLMHEKGVRCTDCHDPHTTKLLAQGNQLCVRCHIPGKYDAPSHHFHKVGSTGAQCVECHMPETTYMTVDPRRDHSFRIPRPDLTQSLDIPNACNRCHDDQSADWSQEHVAKWYGRTEWPKRLDFAATIDAGREGDPKAKKELLRLSRDSYANPYLRASAVSLLRNYPSAETTEACKMALKDPHPLIRARAIQGLEAGLTLAPGMATATGDLRAADRATVEALAEALDDPNRLVRTEAARVLATVPSTALPSGRIEALRAALGEYTDTMTFLSDNAGPNLNLANLHSAQGSLKNAEAYLERAIARDADFLQARNNLALLYNETGRRAEALAEFEEIVRRAERRLQLPDAAVVRDSRSFLALTHYQMGLLLAEEPDGISRAIPHFEKTLEYDPNRHRAAYNLGLAHERLNRPSQAERYLRAALEADPDQNDYAIALAGLYARTDRLGPAIDLLRRAVRLAPRDLRAARMLQQLEGRPDR